MAPRSRWILVGLVAAIPLAVIVPEAVRAAIFASLEPAPLPPIVLPEGVADSSAETCAVCHPDAYREWSATRMARAVTDPVFLADFEAQGQPFVCLRCHAPMAEQQPFVVTGLRSIRPVAGRGLPNPDFDAELHVQGVTCVVCHVRDGAMVGPIADPQGAPHPTAHDPDLGTRCQRCHQLEPPPLSNLERALPDTHAEHAEWQQITGATEGCAYCHMPRVERPAAVDGPVRQVRRHTFTGAWDVELVRGSVRVLDVRREGDRVLVRVENLAGHAVPTAEPARALELVVLDADQAVIGAVELARKVPLPRLREEGDTSLRPAEERLIEIPITGEPAQLRVRFLQLRYLPGGVEPSVRTAHQRPIEIVRRSIDPEP